MAELEMKSLIKPTFFVLCAFFVLSIPSVALSQQPDPYLPFAEVMPQPVGGMGEIYQAMDRTGSFSGFSAGFHRWSGCENVPV